MADYDALASEYARHRQAHPEVLKNLIQTATLVGSSHVLEVGCGTGNYAIALQTAVGCACWGVDPSAQMLTTARKRSQTVHFKRGRAEQLDYPADFFDLVFSVDVIHHVVDRSAFFHEAYRVLKRGGRLCTVTDSEEIIHGRQPLSIYFPETIDVELRRYPPISDLKRMMVDVGFCNLQEAIAESTHSLTDVQAYRDRAFSSLHLISNEAFERGIRHLEEDLRPGPIPSVSRYMLLWGKE